MEWRGESLARLRELAASPEKLSAREIAAHFGCHRNAVIGACRRNNIELPRPATNGHRAERRRPFVPHSQNLEQPASRMATVEPLHLTLMELESHSCRFPYGGDNGEPYTFCGHPDDGKSSYCAAHRRLTENKRPGLSSSDAEIERRRRRMQYVRAGKAA